MFIKEIAIYIQKQMEIIFNIFLLEMFMAFKSIVGNFLILEIAGKISNAIPIIKIFILLVEM